MYRADADTQRSYGGEYNHKRECGEYAPDWKGVTAGGSQTEPLPTLRTTVRDDMARDSVKSHPVGQELREWSVSRFRSRAERAPADKP